MRRALILYECSGVVRQAFAARGWYAYSVDLQPSATLRGEREVHVVGDVFGVLARAAVGAFDVIVAHPPCTYLCASGIHWNARRPERAAQTDDAFAHVMRLVQALDAAKPQRGWAIENPRGILSTRWRKPDDSVQPYEFGDDASKRTDLWLSGLKPLVRDPTRYVQPRMVLQASGRALPRWANQTDSGQNRLGPSAERAQLRATTYPGIARAMADQWGTP